MYRLVIIEDEYEIRTSLCNYIPWDELGFEVEAQMENGLQCLDYIRKNQIDVILTDIKMPGMSGLELAETLFKQKSNVKIVLLSGYREFEFAQKAIMYGVKYYITKPTKYAELAQIFLALKDELDSEYDYASVQNTGSQENIENLGFNEKIIRTVKKYVRENYRNATLENAAKLVYMNPYYLSKFFKDKTEQNFSDFVTICRMEEASNLLKDIKYKVYEVSMLVGYSSPKNFTRAFKKYFGNTPKEYRNNIDVN